MGKAFEHRLTPNASEYEIFLMNLRIDLKYTDCCNLKLKATLYVWPDLLKHSHRILLVTDNLDTILS